MDIFIALIPALYWGNIGLVSGIMGGSAKEQTIGMTCGAFSLSLILTLIFKIITLRIALLNYGLPVF